MASKASKIVTPAKVGVFVIGSALSFAAFLQVVSTRAIDGAGSYEVSAMFDDVLGLEKKSPVQIAGIDVGRIERVELAGGRAKVTMVIDGSVELYDDASIEKVAISMLGDYKLSIEPGGGAGVARLADKGEIKKVKSLSSTDEIIEEVRTMTQAMRGLIAGQDGKPSPLEAIVGDVRGSAAAARTVLEVVSANIGDNTAKLDQILENVNRFTRDLSQISAGRDRDIAAIIADTRKVAHSIANTADAVEQMVAGRDKAEITESVKSLRATAQAMNRSVESLASILDKIDRGDGTLGRFVNDEDVYDEIEEAAEGINSVVGGISRLQTWVNLRSEFQLRSGAAKNYVQFTLMPKEDKYYIFEVVDDPRGVRETVIEDVETTSPADGRSFQYRERRTRTTDDLTFSMMFAKRFYWLALRFGIIEGTGGVGANAYLLNDRVELLLDLNQFGIEARNPRMKFLALAEPIPHVYLHAGVDDFLNPGTLDYFFGAGVRFNDEDLKTLLIAVGVPGGN
jgi:phospholipid/cholesterol/gamma-HCH transport system substrate-binding protein